MTTTSTPDLAAITTRQQATWSTGDYSIIGARIALTSEHLVDTADLRSGDRVLDVACGSGNASLAAARAGCEVTGIDYVPSLLDRARTRAEAEGFAIEFTTGDAQALPFADASFDAAISVVGAMFAPDHQATAGEMLRVTRSGGTIAVANWTPDGFVGQLLKTVGAHVPPPPGVVPGVLWGDQSHIEELFGAGATAIRNHRRTYVFRYPSAEALVEEFRLYYGPVNKAYEAAGDDARALDSDFLALVRASDRRGGGGPVAIPATYLETVVTRR
jgi:SAM-dependent methyltransferase